MLPKYLFEVTRLGKKHKVTFYEALNYYYLFSN